MVRNFKLDKQQKVPVKLQGYLQLLVEQYLMLMKFAISQLNQEKDSISKHIFLGKCKLKFTNFMDCSLAQICRKVPSMIPFRKQSQIFLIRIEFILKSKCQNVNTAFLLSMAIQYSLHVAMLSKIGIPNSNHLYSQACLNFQAHF